jgi:hypothetical protein
MIAPARAFTSITVASTAETWPTGAPFVAPARKPASIAVAARFAPGVVLPLEIRYEVAIIIDGFIAKILRRFDVALKSGRPGRGVIPARRGGEPSRAQSQADQSQADRKSDARGHAPGRRHCKSNRIALNPLHGRHSFLL